MNPIVTIATCFILMVSWNNPDRVYAGEIQGGVVVDGELRFLTLRGNTEELAWWTTVMQPKDRIVESGFVAVTANPSSIEIANLPIMIACERLYLPEIFRIE